MRPLRWLLRQAGDASLRAEALRLTYLVGVAYVDGQGWRGERDAARKLAADQRARAVRAEEELAEARNVLGTAAPHGVPLVDAVRRLLGLLEASRELVREGEAEVARGLDDLAAAVVERDAAKAEAERLSADLRLVDRDGKLRAQARLEAAIRQPPWGSTGNGGRAG